MTSRQVHRDLAVEAARGTLMLYVSDQILDAAASDVVEAIWPHAVLAADHGGGGEAAPPGDSGLVVTPRRSGPGHYREAERLLGICGGPQRGTELDKSCTAAALVHATLALAAATALKSGGSDGHSLPDADFRAWAHVAGSESDA